MSTPPEKEKFSSIVVMYAGEMAELRYATRHRPRTFIGRYLA